MISVRVWLAKRAMVIKPRLVGRHVHVWYDNITCCPQHRAPVLKEVPSCTQFLPKKLRNAAASLSLLLRSCCMLVFSEQEIGSDLGNNGLEIKY